MKKNILKATALAVSLLALSGPAMAQSTPLGVSVNLSFSSSFTTARNLNFFLQFDPATYNSNSASTNVSFSTAANGTDTVTNLVSGITNQGSDTAIVRYCDAPNTLYTLSLASTTVAVSNGFGADLEVQGLGFLAKKRDSDNVWTVSANPSQNIDVTTGDNGCVDAKIVGTFVTNSAENTWAEMSNVDSPTFTGIVTVNRL